MNFIRLGHAIRKGVILTALPCVFLSGLIATGGETMLTQERVKELFDYREDGTLIRKTLPERIIGIGKKHRSGYHRVGIDGKMVYVHRVVFLYHHGYVPGEIDHINRDRDDNRIENLRASNRSMNERNKGLRKDNSSGKVGVIFDKKAKKWRAQIKVDGKNIILKKTDRFDEAVSARIQAELSHFGHRSPA